MSELLVNTIKKADGTGSLSVPAESGTVVTTASPSLGRRNLIINGAMQVWQRTTSKETVANNEYIADRFRMKLFGTDGNLDVARESTIVPDGFGYSLKLSMDASEASLAPSDQVRIQQRIEGQNLQQLKKGTADAEKLTLSFWVRSSVASTYTVQIGDIDNARTIGKTYTIDTADTWEYKTLTFDGDTSTGDTFDNDNNASLQLTFWMDAGSTYTSGTFATSWADNVNTNEAYDTTGWLESTSPTFYITGVQLEVGDTATPFEHRSYGEELLSCLRYFWQITGASGNKDNFAIGMCHNTTQLFTQVHFPAPMRIEPTTVAESDLQAVVAATGYNVSFNSVSDMHEYGGRVTFDADSGTWTAGNAGIVRVADSASSFISFDAEL